MKRIDSIELQNIEGGCLLDMGIAFAGMVGSTALGPIGIITGSVWAYRFISAARTCK